MRLSKFAFLAVLALAVGCFLGCESVSGSGLEKDPSSGSNNSNSSGGSSSSGASMVSVSPSRTEFTLVGQTSTIKVVDSAPDANDYRYTWALSNASIGSLDASEGTVVVYTANQVSSTLVKQTVTVSAIHRVTNATAKHTLTFTHQSK